MSRQRDFIGAILIVLLWTSLALSQDTTCPSQICWAGSNLGQTKISLIDYEARGQYDRDILTVVDQAKIYLAQQSSRRGKLAIVLDIDETSLSNWPEMKANDFGFFLNGPCDLGPDGSVQAPCGWKKWVSLEKSFAIAPTLDLYQQARRQRLEVFFITGRSTSQRNATGDNLRSAGYDGWNDSDLIMEPDNVRPPSVAYFKSAERKKIVDRGYTIVLNMGDQDSDLIGGFADRAFKLPNPFYYIP